MANPPADVIALAEERQAARAARDFQRSDSLRDEIADLGWVISDHPEGFRLEAKPPYKVQASLSDVRPSTDLNPHSVAAGIIVEGWVEDAIDSLQRLLEHSSDLVVHVFDVANESETGVRLEEFARSHPGLIDLHHLGGSPGWGPMARRLLEISTAPLHLLMDPSTLFEGDALAPLVAAMEEPSIFAAGWRGGLVDVEDEWRNVVDRGPGEVDVLNGYLMLVRRNEALATDLPHPKARFYRNADLEFSLHLRARGGRLVAMDLPVAQGRHHGYYDSEPEFRERESRRTYDRLLKSFRGRTEILSPRR
jgi:hypothetical protein